MSSGVIVFYKVCPEMDGEQQKINFTLNRNTINNTWEQRKGNCCGVPVAGMFHISLARLITDNIE